ncbi:hypothetical protein COLO4_00740 [Corchorus olitorius]|uniref:Uncharacterized protein n=1 Tax=Corchorus olitorius TaxID=93759 RepID=A0A1R3L3G0_9ROSI|nr:hypothetical protein COLO4_00740 [Corchorus olitorius]
MDESGDSGSFRFFKRRIYKRLRMQTERKTKIKTESLPCRFLGR